MQYSFRPHCCTPNINGVNNILKVYKYRMAKPPIYDKLTYSVTLIPPIK